MARRGEDIHHTVGRIDGSMAALTRTLARFGAPQEIKDEIRGAKRAVGDVIAQLEMAERRSEE